MRGTTLLMTLVALPLCANAQGIIIVQENDDLEYFDDWDFTSTGTIIIKQAYEDETFIFWAHVDGQPNTLAAIEDITRAQAVTSGTIKVQVSKEGGPGATDIGAITFDTEQITSIIEGITITGDLLTDAAATVDHVTGPITAGGSLKNTMTVHGDFESDLTILDAIESGVDVQIGGDLLDFIIVDELRGNVTIAGDVVGLSQIRPEVFTGNIDVQGRAPSAVAAPFPPFRIGQFDGGTLRVRQGSVADSAGPGNDAVLVRVFVATSPATQVYDFSAAQPRFYDESAPWSGGGGAADTDYTFDITVTQPTTEGPLVATIVLNDPGTPTGQFDLHVPMDLARLTLAPELLEDPYPYLNNIYVAGDVSTGEEEFAIDIPDAAVNSIYIGGVLGSEDGEENLLDRVRVASIGTLAFGSLGSEDFYVPEDGVSGSGTAIIVADEFVQPNDFIQLFGASFQPSAFHYSHAESTGSPPGFTRHFAGPAPFVSFYHRNPSDECILDSCAGPASWCCAKGPITDIDNNGVVHLADFGTFATCFSKTEPDQDCPCDVFAHCDLNLDGVINLSDFSTFASGFLATGDGERDGDCCSSPPCEEGLADLEFIQEFLEETIEPLISGDNDWVESIQALTAEIAAFEPEEEYEGIVEALIAINFMPVAVDSTNTVAKNGSKIMSLGTATDPDGDTLLVDLVTTDPAHGTISEAAYDFDGNLVSFQYIPDTDYTGEDTLTWRATEVGTTQQYYDEAVITITVTE